MYNLTNLTRRAANTFHIKLVYSITTFVVILLPLLMATSFQNALSPPLLLFAPRQTAPCQTAPRQTAPCLYATHRHRHWLRRTAPTAVLPLACLTQLQSLHTCSLEAGHSTEFLQYVCTRTPGPTLDSPTINDMVYIIEPLIYISRGPLSEPQARTKFSLILVFVPWLPNSPDLLPEFGIFT